MDIEHSQANRFKEQGNEAYKNKEYLKAIQLYSKAIELNPKDANYYSNRALCHFNLNRF